MFCLIWNKLCRLHIVLLFILSDVFRFSLPFGGVTIRYYTGCNGFILLKYTYLQPLPCNVQWTEQYIVRTMYIQRTVHWPVQCKYTKKQWCGSGSRGIKSVKKWSEKRAEFNQQKSFFFQRILYFSSLNLKKVRSEWLEN